MKINSILKNLRNILVIKEVKKFLIIFYIVGFIGFALPWSQKIFIFLIPYAIILSLVLVLFFHESKSRKKDIVNFVIIFLLGFFVEVVGVNTGKIFGEYHYGDGLGIKIFNTPLLIGVNWLMLVYCSANILSLTKLNFLSKAFLSSLLMVAYDLILEQVASKIALWYWKQNVVPIQNYLAWFLIAFFMHLIFRQVENKNPVAALVFILQTIFFFLLFLFLNFN